VSDEATTIIAISALTLAAAGTAASIALQPKPPSLLAQSRSAVPPRPPAVLPLPALPSTTEATEGEAEERRRITQRSGFGRTLLTTPLGEPRTLGTGA